MARVEGFEPAQSGQQPVDSNGDPVAVGVWGDSSTGVGVFGTSGEPPPAIGNIATQIAGVEGHSYQHPGVFGLSVEDAGVRGESLQGQGMLARSISGSGILGVTFTPTVPGEPPAAHGVFGVSTAGGNGVTGFVGDATGVVGNSVRGTGVRGISGAAHGVVGESFGSPEGRGDMPAGVFGRTETGFGVRGISGAGYGVVGESLGSPPGRGEIAAGVFGRSETGFGVRGVGTANSGMSSVTFGGGDGASALHFSNQGGSGVAGTSVVSTGVNGFSFGGVGVRGEGRNGGVHGFANSTATNAAAILGQNPSGFAGVFLGRVLVTGFLSKGGGGFEIDHPLDPANKYLRHSFVECPEMLNVYSGTVTTDDNGEANVGLPKYIEALNQDFRYQLTVIGQFAQAIVAQEIRDNEFTIKTDQPRVKVSWQVIGVRRDPWAEANRMVVEEEKAAADKGRYLHPEAWGLGAQAAMHRSTDEQAQSGADQLRQLTELLPESLSERAKRHLEALARGEHVDHEDLRSLLAEAKQQAALPAAGAPPRADRARLEEEWHRVEELVQSLGSMPWQPGPEAPRAQLRQVSDAVPEQLRPRVERHLQALLRGERVPDEELRRLVAEARGLAEPDFRQEPRPSRERLEEDWQTLQALVQPPPGEGRSGNRRNRNPRKDR